MGLLKNDTALSLLLLPFPYLILLPHSPTSFSLSKDHIFYKIKRTFDIIYHSNNGKENASMMVSVTNGWLAQHCSLNILLMIFFPHIPLTTPLRPPSISRPSPALKGNESSMRAKHFMKEKKRKTNKKAGENSPKAQLSCTSALTR